MKSRQERLNWFRDARFGLFIHWGLYSLIGRGEWAMVTESWPADTYARLASRFKPRRFDADAWADLAVAAGMKYGVMVTRHCDGFCLFDSAHSVGGFTSARTAAGRDFVRAYVDAFRRRGLKVGLYYSLADWREPGMFDPARYPESARRMVDSVHRQVEELMTAYGQIDILWYDGWYWEWCRNKWRGAIPCISCSAAGPVARRSCRIWPRRSLMPGCSVAIRRYPCAWMPTAEPCSADYRRARRIRTPTWLC
jgi:alpha-L-fucosidase